MKKLLVLIVIISSFAYANEGTLILAHGSMKGCGYDNPTLWEQKVHKIIERVRSQVNQPIQIAFGMWNTMCFNQGVERLKQRMQHQGKQLTKLNVLPLFISSHSMVMEMQRYIFKVRPDRPFDMPMAKIINFDGEINYMNAIDYNPYVSMILANRLHSLIHLAKDQGYAKSQMDVVLVMHGPVMDVDNLKWMEMAQKYMKDINYLFPLAKNKIVSLRDDASDEIRDAATKELRAFVNNSSRSGKITLVLPLLMSKGGIEQGILERLDGLNYVWNGEMLLPDPFFDQVLINRIN